MEGRWGAGSYVAGPKERLGLVCSRNNGQPDGPALAHDAGDAVETADVVVPAARCELVYELPVT